MFRAIIIILAFALVLGGTSHHVGLRVRPVLCQCRIPLQVHSAQQCEWAWSARGAGAEAEAEAEAHGLVSDNADDDSREDPPE